MIKVSTKTRYGLRFLIYLANQADPGPVQLAQVSQNEAISLKYLGHIATQLRVAGLVRSVRGAGGGYQLARSYGEITLKDLVESLEGGIGLVDCLNSSSCARRDQCLAREVWCIVSERMNEVFQSFTLQDILDLSRRKKPADFII